MAPLTREHAKPMLPFGGIYRLVDVTLSNCVNSGLSRIYILTQHKALSLNRHVRETWNILPAELGQFIEVLPPTRRLRETWYLGTADAVYQNIRSIEDENPSHVLILSADHVYKMNYAHMLECHNRRRADVTVATTQVNPAEAGRFGILDIDRDSRIRGLEEKPRHGRPWRSRLNPTVCSASMGIYLFTTEVLLQALLEDARDDSSSHDFGRSILPRLVAHRRVAAYDFIDENRKEGRYWRDVGTLDSYYEANMDLVAVSPVFNLYDDSWPLRTSNPRLPPAKFVFADEGRRMGIAVDSLVSHGCIVSGGRVTSSILSPGVRVNSHAEVEGCILFAGVHIGRCSRVHRAIVDADVRIPEHAVIGLDPEADRAAGHFVTASGIVIVHGDSPGLSSSPSGAAAPCHAFEAVRA